MIISRHDWVETVHNGKVCVKCGTHIKSASEECLGDFALDEELFIEKAKTLCRERYLKKGAGHVGFELFGEALAAVFLGLSGIEEMDENDY